MKNQYVFFSLGIITVIIIVVVATWFFYPVSENHSSTSISDPDKVSVNSGKPYLSKEYSTIVYNGENWIRESDVIKLFHDYYYEWGYFKGQKAAIEGKYRIKLDNEGIYYWTESVWKDETPATFIPTKDDSQ